jgi:hypothetical protein
MNPKSLTGLINNLKSLLTQKNQKLVPVKVYARNRGPQKFDKGK